LYCIIDILFTSRPNTFWQQFHSMSSRNKFVTLIHGFQMLILLISAEVLARKKFVLKVMQS